MNLLPRLVFALFMFYGGVSCNSTNESTTFWLATAKRVLKPLQIEIIEFSQSNEEQSKEIFGSGPLKIENVPIKPIILLPKMTTFWPNTKKIIFEKNPVPRKGYTFQANEVICLTTVDPEYYEIDLWLNSKSYNESDPHFICCNEDFNENTIIPWFVENDVRSSKVILLNSFNELTKNKTNCSIFYGHWMKNDDFISPHFPPQLSIHPLAIRTLAGG